MIINELIELMNGRVHDFVKSGEKQPVRSDLKLFIVVHLVFWIFCWSRREHQNWKSFSQRC